jgi:hypothetical protein
LRQVSRLDDTTMSPTGWYGTICAICFETLTAETAHRDPEGQLHDACAGRCAALAGHVPPEHQAEHDALVAAIHAIPFSARTTGEVAEARRRYYAFIDRITS